MNVQGNCRLEPGCGALRAALRTLWLLFLTLCLLQPIAYSQEPTTPPAPENAVGAEASPQIDLCDKTKNPGQTVRVIGNDEILLVYRNDSTNQYLRNRVIDFDLATSKLLSVTGEGWYTDPATATNTWWLSAAAGDLSGISDGKRMDRLIVGFQNSYGQVAAIADASKIGATDKAWWCQMAWDRNRCDNIQDVAVAAGNLDKSSDASDEIALFFRDQEEDYFLLTLDGDSNGAISTTGDSWVARYGEDHHPGRERGNIHHLSVATGDLNGDGFDNEVVTALKDSGSDLQVGVHRGDTLGEIFYWDSYHGNPKLDTVANACDGDWQNWRPIDVATGDVDGDAKDEVIVATRYGSGDCWFDGVRLLVFDFKAEDPSTHALSINATVPVTNIQVDLISGYKWESAPTVEVSAADLDVDGLDEIVLGYVVEYMNDGDTYGQNHEQPRLRTYDYFRTNTPDWQANCNTSKQEACIKQKAAYDSLPVYNFSYHSSETDWEARLSIATGDVDADGMAEIAVSRLDPTSHDVDLRVFDAQSGLTQLGSMIVDLGTEPIHDPTVVMGDYDGDSKWGTYQNTCHDKKQALVQAVLHAPPYWPHNRGLNGCDNDWNTFASFGLNTSTSETTETSLETHIGGSTGMEKTFKGVTASFSRGWERSRMQSTSVTTSTKEAVGTHTTPPVESPDAPSYETILMIEDTQWCYDYGVLGLDESNPTATVTVPVCVYQEGLQAQTEKRGSWWYGDSPDGNGRKAYSDSWVPVGMNLAEDKTQTQRIAYQRTTYSTSSPYGYAKLANDGNTDGIWKNGSVAHTSSEVDPYWQLDLGGLQWIDAVQIWNRTDCCTNQLKDFYVLVTDKAAWPTTCSVSGASCSCDDPACMKEQPGVWDTFVSGEAGRPTTLTVGQYGRNLRIQRETGSTATVMNIAEVQVYGMPGTPDQWPSAISPATLTAAANSFTLTWGRAPAATRTATINRPLYLVWSSQLYTSQGSGPKTFLTGIGTGRQQMYGSGSGKSLTVGLQTKRKRSLSLGIGYEAKQSQATTWEKGVEFGGQVWGLGDAAPELLQYYWKPYVWTQQAVPEGGGAQEFLVLDYVVPTAQTIVDPVQTPDKCPATEFLAASTGPLAGPQAPVVDSPTHPDPDTWYDSNAVTFTWEQPAGDPATVQVYDWVLDQSPDTIPTGLHSVMTTTLAYDFVQNGTYYLHVRAMNDAYEWGDTAHRMVRVDAKPPQVGLALDPPTPTGNGEWYITPVTVAVNAADTDGSGVTGVEVSTDGGPWQPYSAPLALSADTAGTTVWARAIDALGNVSEPVSTTVKIDTTPPESDTLVAGMTTNAAGNDMLVLAGSITDNLSGRAGMVLEQDAFYWGANAKIGSWHPLPDPAIEVNWVYTATNDLGAGYHVITGRAQDEAGNREDAHEIGRVLWLPKATPDLGGSSMAASQTTARPGDAILITLVARNAGYQEAHVGVSATLPEGLEPALEELPGGIVYDPASRTVTWPARLMWPGWWRPARIPVRVDAGLGATNLEIEATFHAFWPNTDLLPEAERQQFEDREQTVVATATVVVDPGLPAEVDLIAPWAILAPPSRPRVAGAQLSLGITAAPDAQRMYLREWTPDSITGDWTVVQDSGWIDYSETYTWTLSAGQGVKYLGVWVADGTGNISALTEHSLVFVNRMDAGQVLADGQRIQYRGLPQEGDVVSLFLTTVSGDPDAYLWEPRNAFWPSGYANDTFLPGEKEYLSKQFEEGGRYLLEVQAVGDSEYELSEIEQGFEVAAASRAAVEKARPEHPLTISDPLSAGQLGPDVTLGFKIYLPVLFEGY